MKVVLVTSTYHPSGDLLKVETNTQTTSLHQVRLLLSTIEILRWTSTKVTLTNAALLSLKRPLKAAARR